MSIVNIFGSGHPASQQGKLIDRRVASINPTRLCSKATITSGDNTGSQYFLGKIPQNAIISYPAYLWTPQLTGVTSLKLGSSADDDALGNFDLITGSPGAIHRPLAPVFGGSPSYTDFAWRVLGFSAPPETEIDLIATLGGNAGATGIIQLQLEYAGY